MAEFWRCVIRFSKESEEFVTLKFQIVSKEHFCKDAYFLYFPKLDEKILSQDVVSLA